MSIIIDFLFSLFLLLISPSDLFAAISFVIDTATPSGNEVTLSASISGLISSSCGYESKCFLQGVFKPTGGSRYFGQTLNLLNNWIDYQSTPELEFLQSSFYSFIPESGSWSGQVKMRFFPDDENYVGPGSYEVKLRRFSGKSSNPSGDSNVLTLSLSPTIPTPTPTQTPTPTPTPSPTTSPSPISTPTPTPSPKPTFKPTIAPTITSSPTAEPTLDLASVLGASSSASPSAESATSPTKPKSSLVLIGVTTFSALVSLGIFIFRLLHHRAVQYKL